MEKYFDAAEAVVRALIAEKPSVPEQRRGRSDFKLVAEPGRGRSVHEASMTLPHRGQYDVGFKINLGSFDPFRGRVRAQIFLDGRLLVRRSFAAGNRSFPFRLRLPLAAGEHVWRFDVDLSAAELGKGSPIHLNIDDVVVRGPGRTVDYPEPHKRLFFQGPPPRDTASRWTYAREILRRVADRAFRRPVEEGTVDCLAEIGRAGDGGRPGDFERGVGHALAAILISPRFLFRPEPAGGAIDDWALATRLSYLLWSTAPDAELESLAATGALRTQLRPTIERLLTDQKADRFVSNFVGQWLHTRDVDDIPVSGRKGRLLNESLRRLMRGETEMLFAHILREERDAAGDADRRLHLR